MLHLHFAPSLDLLVADLTPLLRDAWHDPFAPPEVIVPNPVVGKWLQMRLADGTCTDSRTVDGCVANLPMPTIEHFLWKVLQPEASWELLDQGRLQQVICALLDESFTMRSGFESVKTYLTGPSGGIDALKRVQLSARIANRLLEYEYNRPGVWRANEGVWRPEGIDGAWMRSRDYLAQNDIDEQWQAELYRQVRVCFSSTGPAAPTPTYLSLPQLYRVRRDNGNSEKKLRVVDPGTIFMFGVTKVSHFHRNLFVEISQMNDIDLHVFLTNPCAEFWEDVDTRRGLLRRSWQRSSENPGIAPRKPDDYDKEELALCTTAPLPADQKLLELWGNAGKENIFLWCQDAQWNFDYHTRDKGADESIPGSILEALQYSLLRRQNCMQPLPESGNIPDGSLQILACPDRGREMEEIRELILDAIRDHSAPLLDDIVVYLPDPAAYVPYIQRVFGRFSPNDPRHIPFCILGSSGKASIAARGITVLIDIFETHFDRARIFELLHNPIVQTARRIDAASVSLWEHWADGCAMYRGYDREHRIEMGDAGSAITDMHTFGLGMARMLLSDLAEGTVSLGFTDPDENRREQAIPIIPYRDFETSDRPLLEQFCATIEALHDGGTALRKAIGRGIEPALDTLTELVMLWFGTLPDDGDFDIAAEGGMVRSFLDNIRMIALQDQCAGRSTIPRDEFFALIRGGIPEELPARSCAWTGGITFAPLRPSMIIPHRVVFVAGLDAESFPGSNERPSWDLLSRKRIIGDSDRVRDNRFAFLELIHAARERLIISYRARDMRREEELQPSSVVLELATFLCDQGFVANNQSGKNVCSLLREVPWIVHESLGTALSTARGRPHGSWEATEHDLYRLSGAPRVGHRHDLDPAPALPVENAHDFRITLFDLRTYFANPLEFHLKRTLGLDNIDDSADMAASDEPIDSGARALSNIQHDIWKSMLRLVFSPDPHNGTSDEQTLLHCAREQALRSYRDHAANGGAPEALIGRMEKDFIIEWAATCIAPARELKQAFPDHMLFEHTDPALLRDGVPATINISLVNGRHCSIECAHSLVLIPRSGTRRNDIAIMAIKKEGLAAENPALWLEGMLQWLWEAGQPQRRTISLVQLTSGTGDSPACDFDAVPLKACDDPTLAGAIDKWLAALLAEMLIDRGCDHLPFACIQKYRDKLSMSVIAEDLAAEHPGYRSYLPAFALVDARLPGYSDETLGAVVRNRFAPMLDAWLIAGGAPH